MAALEIRSCAALQRRVVGLRALCGEAVDGLKVGKSEGMEGRGDEEDKKTGRQVDDAHRCDHSRPSAASCKAVECNVDNA